MIRPRKLTYIDKAYSFGPIPQGLFRTDHLFEFFFDNTRG